MKKNEIIAQIADKNEVSKTLVTNVINTLFDEVVESLKKDGVASFSGFGNFTMKLRAARQGRNPKTGEIIEIKEQNVVGFKPASSLKEKIAVEELVD